MDDHTINDIYSYMEALNTYNPGDSVEISVRRSGQTLRLNLQF
jgi:S1-C subfamily serine protease